MQWLMWGGGVVVYPQADSDFPTLILSCFLDGLGLAALVGALQNIGNHVD